MELVAQTPNAVTAQQISARSGIPAPSVYRLLGLLIEEGYLSRSADGLGVRLGERSYPMAGLLARQLAWPTVADARFRAEPLVAGPVVAAVRDGDRFTFPDWSVDLLGDVSRWHANALGKLLVAYRRDLLSQLTYRRYAAVTHAHRDSLVRELDWVVDRGYCLERGESEPGRHAVAVGVFAPDGVLLGALHVPAEEGDDLESMAATVQQASRGRRAGLDGADPIV